MGPLLLAAVGVTVVCDKWEEKEKPKNKKLREKSQQAEAPCDNSPQKPCQCARTALLGSLEGGKNCPLSIAQELFNPLHLQLLSVSGCF